MVVCDLFMNVERSTSALTTQECDERTGHAAVGFQLRGLGFLAEDLICTRHAKTLVNTIWETLFARSRQDKSSTPKAKWFNALHDIEQQE